MPGTHFRGQRGRDRAAEYFKNVVTVLSRQNDGLEHVSQLDPALQQLRGTAEIENGLENLRIDRCDEPICSGHASVRH